MEYHVAQEGLVRQIASREAELISVTQRLVAAASPNPPGDTTLVADAAAILLNGISGAKVARYETAPGITNLVARVSSGRLGKRLVFNGHLDTFPICEHLNWTVPPLDGLIKNGSLYGRGVSDMKGGIAASIVATSVLAEHKQLWSGEIVITLAGDEESMGTLGTQWLLENVEEARGDVMICGDAGSPRIVRFGEKGLCWFEITASGVSAHGAHVHKGTNAIDRLRQALDAVKLLEGIHVDEPEISEAVAVAKSVSEAESGEGESRTLQHMTVNIGIINGGTLPNLIPSQAQAQGDIRLPVGTSVSTVEAHFQQHLDPMEGVEWRITRSYEPTYTSPSHPLIQSALAASKQVMGLEPEPVINMRVGASDARLYRAAGIPSVVVGCTPHGMGGADEFVEVQELVKVAQIHALIAYDLLRIVES